jgi:hypothetical protein
MSTTIHIYQYLIRDGYQSVRALRSEVHRDNAKTQPIALLWRRRPR